MLGGGGVCCFCFFISQHTQHILIKVILGAEIFYRKNKVADTGIDLRKAGNVLFNNTFMDTWHQTYAKGQLRQWDRKPAATTTWASISDKQQGFIYMYHLTDIAHTTAFGAPAMEHWLGMDLMTHCTMSGHYSHYTGATFHSRIDLRSSQSLGHSVITVD